MPGELPFPSSFLSSILARAIQWRPTSNKLSALRVCLTRWYFTNMSSVLTSTLFPVTGFSRIWTTTIPIFEKHYKFSFQILNVGDIDPITSNLCSFAALILVLSFNLQFLKGIYPYVDGCMILRMIQIKQIHFKFAAYHRIIFGWFCVCLLNTKASLQMGNINAQLHIIPVCSGIS